MRVINLAYPARATWGGPAARVICRSRRASGTSGSCAAGRRYRGKPLAWEWASRRGRRGSERCCRGGLNWRRHRVASESRYIVHTDRTHDRLRRLTGRPGGRPSRRACRMGDAMAHCKRCCNRARYGKRLEALAAKRSHGCILRTARAVGQMRSHQWPEDRRGRCLLLSGVDDLRTNGQSCGRQWYRGGSGGRRADTAGASRLRSLRGRGSSGC